MCGFEEKKAEKTEKEGSGRTRTQSRVRHLEKQLCVMLTKLVRAPPFFGPRCLQDMLSICVVVGTSGNHCVGLSQEETAIAGPSIQYSRLLVAKPQAWVFRISESPLRIVELKQDSILVSGWKGGAISEAQDSMLSCTYRCFALCVKEVRV